jgi:fructose-specific phosphotransferase system component IIB
MTNIFAIVEAGDAGVSGVLAAEALRRAARKLGRAIEIELRTAQGAVNPVAPGDDAPLLFIAPDGVNDPQIDARSHGRLTLEAVLANPDAALGLLSVGRRHPCRASLRSHPVPRASPIPSWPPRACRKARASLATRCALKRRVRWARAIR